MMRTGIQNRARKIDTLEVTPSGGNVFEDLGLSNAKELLHKAELARRLCAVIAERGLTQAKAAALLGIDQPKVSALKSGKLGGFSTDRLFRFLNLLGQEVEITIRPARKADGQAGTYVVVA